MEILVNGIKIETKEIASIYDIERDKTMFLNREAGFVIQFLDGSKKVFGEKIPYESYTSEIAYKKQKWETLQNDITKKWQKDKHDLQEFNID